MPQKPILENPVYTIIIYTIQRGRNSPFLIRKELSKVKKKLSKGAPKSLTLTDSNVSMKLRRLREHNLVVTKRHKSIKRTSTATHNLFFPGFVKLAVSKYLNGQFLKQYQRGFDSSKLFAKLTKNMELYLDALANRDEEHHRNEYEFISIEDLMRQWLKGIGLSHYRPIQDQYHLPNLPKSEWEMFRQFTFNCWNNLNLNRSYVTLSEQIFREI